MADWSGLGFNPAPGDVCFVEETARDTRVFAESLQSDARLLRSVGRSVTWVGEAADAFRGNLDDLPRELDKAADSFRETALALTHYGRSLDSAQQRARGLEQSAKRVRDDLRWARNALASMPRDDPGREAQARSVDRLEDQLDDLRRDAERVEEEVRDAGTRAGRLIKDASRHAPEEPGMLQKLGNGLAGFVRDHAAVIAGFSKVLKGLGAALGIASLFLFWVPGVGQALTAASLTLTVGATLLDTALWASGAVDPATGAPYATGRDVLVGAGSAALFFVGGTAASGLARASGGAARARAAGVVAPNVNRGRVVMREFRQTLQFARPSTAGAWGRRVQSDFATFRHSWGASGAPSRSWFAPHVESSAAAAWTAVSWKISQGQTVYDNAQFFGDDRRPQIRPASAR